MVKLLSKRNLQKIHKPPHSPSSPMSSQLPRVPPSPSASSVHVSAPERSLLDVIREPLLATEFKKLKLEKTTPAMLEEALVFLRGDSPEGCFQNTVRSKLAALFFCAVAFFRESMFCALGIF